MAERQAGSKAFQLGLAVLQLGGLGGECLQSGGEVDVAESAGLEGEQVALDRFFGAAQLGLDHVEFVLVLVADLSRRAATAWTASSNRSVRW